MNVRLHIENFRQPHCLDSRLLLVTDCSEYQCLSCLWTWLKVWITAQWRESPTLLSFASCFPFMSTDSTVVFFFCHYYTNVKCLHLLLVDIWIVLVFVIDCRCWRIIFWWKETLYILGLYSGVELLGHKSGRLIRWCPHYQTAFMRSCTSFTVPPAVGEGLICAPSSPALCMVFPFSWFWCMCFIWYFSYGSVKCV